MKKFYPILITCMLLALPLKAQWKQTLTGQSSLMDAISVVNDSVIWIKDQNGDKFSITLNGGRTWTTKSFPAGLTTSTVCTCLSAVSDKVAFVIVSMPTATDTQGVYKTTNGGDTWIRQETAFNSPSSFPDLVYFWNENEGLIIGDGISATNGILEMYTTTDGGAQWNPVPAANMPVTGSTDWSTASQSFIRVHGSTVYVMGGTSSIYKSINKGLNWTVINTPATVGSNVRFDFSENGYGILSNYNPSTFNSSVYGSFAGENWEMIYATSLINDIKYISTAGEFFITGTEGLTYSTNSATFIRHPSFMNVGLQTVGYTPSGTIFVGGWSYIYSASNFKGLNLSVDKARLTGLKNIDLTFSSSVELTGAQDISNYLINYRPDNVAIYSKIPLLSATVDPYNNAVVHLVTDGDLPYDTCYINVYNITGINGISVLNKTTGSSASVVHAVLKDYSTIKYALIGTGYFLDNIVNGTKAQWNICWQDIVNNIQPSVPVISGNGTIYTWNFPGVYMNGGSGITEGMFKFCIPTYNNAPDWTIEPVGSQLIDSYTGSAKDEVDRVTDLNGALWILTSGLTKKYDMKLIIDQSTGIDFITLEVNSTNTAVSSVDMNEELIVSYRIYSETGVLLVDAESTGGLKLQTIKQTLNKGVYLINAKLGNGQYQNYKFIVQ